MKIIKKIDEVLIEQGYAGSTNIPKIVFLAATTRLFKTPVSLAVFGPSGVGKSYAVESGLQFIPPSEIEYLSGMSEKALPYLGAEMSLKHRVLFLGEAAGMADGNGRAFLRQLMTEGKIDYLTVQKTNKGLAGEKLPTVEGPICFMMTTTANRIHHEDQSRMLILNMDYNPETIRQVLKNNASGKTKRNIEIDLKYWYNIQEEIKSNPTDVEIPYAEKLADLMPIDNIKIQRDFPKIISMLEACALVHKKERERSNNRGVIADSTDYEIIYDLLSVPLSQGLEANVTPGIRAVVEKLEALGKEKSRNSNEGISQSRLSEVIDADRSSVVRNVQAAIAQGYVENLTPGKGREAKLILGERKLSSSEALPHPDILFDRLPREQVHRCTSGDENIDSYYEDDQATANAESARQWLEHLQNEKSSRRPIEW